MAGCFAASGGPLGPVRAGLGSIRRTLIKVGVAGPLPMAPIRYVGVLGQVAHSEEAAMTM